MIEIHTYDPEDEVWLPTGYEGYFVSNAGHIWGPGKHGHAGLLKPTPNIRTGHLEVSLHVNGVRIRKYIHRLVAEAFIPNPHNYPIVRHLDDDPSNNQVENLAWGTQRDNMRDAIRNGTFKHFTDESRELAMKKRRTPIRAINLETGKEIIFESQQEAARALNLNQSSINKILLNNGNSAKGYHFRYMDDDSYVDISKIKRVRHKALIKATNVMTGEEMVFKGQTAAANALGMSVASVSMVLSGKHYQLRGYHFEYVNEEGYDD